MSPILADHFGNDIVISVLWDFTHIDMGLGFGNPQLATTSAGTLLFVSNGYDSTNEKPFLYALTHRPVRPS